MARGQTGSDPLQTQTDLGGMAYPVGYMLAAFPGEDKARTVQTALGEAGFAPDACRHYSGGELAAIARRQLDENSGWFATLGRTDDILKKALAAAERGAAFLLIHAPDDALAARAMESVRRVPFEFVHRYHSLAIEQME